MAASPPTTSRTYTVGAGYTVNGRTLLAPGQAKAQRTSAGALIREAAAQLEAAVTQAYLNVLLQNEQLVLAEQERERADFNLRLAEGQLEVGTATRLDVTQAEVAVGRAQVAALQAETDVYTSKVRLAQQIGLDPSSEFEVATRFELETPRWTEGQLYDLALEQNPTLGSVRALERSSDYGVKMARSSYFPSLSLSAGFSGFTRQASDSDFLVASARQSALGQVQQCEALNELFTRLSDPLPTADCSRFNLTPAAEQAIRDDNESFPFNFENSPPTFGLSVSIPIFQGFSRQQQVDQARVQRDDLRHQIREQELRLSGDIAAGLAACAWPMKAR